MIKAILLTLLVIASFGGVFAAGYVLGDFTVKEPISTTNTGDPLFTFSKGSYYFDDTAILITDTVPRMALVATNVRSETSGGNVQNTRISFFDGTKWVRKTLSQSINDMNIYSNSLVQEWKLKVDQSRVLKESISGKITISSIPVTFKSEELQNELALRSLPGYTKFMSEAPAILNVDGKDYKAHILYTKIYSLNSAELQFYDKPLGINTDWVIFWDAKGNFYHVDKTDVSRPTDLYMPHQIAILKEAKHGVVKTFNVQVERDTASPPYAYTFTLGQPVNYVLNFKNEHSFEKSAGWYLGIVEGTSTSSEGETLSGFGLVEYIKD